MINVRQVIRSAFRLKPISSAMAIPSKRWGWSIGIYVGQSPLSLTTPVAFENPVLTYKNVSDARARFVADPFMLRVGQTWYMFFEVRNQVTGKGEIGLATSGDGLRWSYQQIVLAEKFHLSYPYVFQWMNDFYMLPESRRAGAARLYKALEFPFRWGFVGTLLSGAFGDPSIFRHDSTWWLFTETSPDSKDDCLRLYYADRLQGPWLEHPKSPVVDGNPHSARPAGRVLVAGGQMTIRYAQDCFPEYGTQVRAFEITELTKTSYCEREVDESPVLRPSGAGWNHSGMHHVDPHLLSDGRWIACVDGRSRRGGGDPGAPAGRD